MASRDSRPPLIPARRNAAGISRSFGVLAAVLRNRQLFRAQLAFFGFNMAEYGTWIAIMVFGYHIGGTEGAGVLGALQLVVAAAVAPFLSLLGDRYRRDRVLVVGYLSQAVLMGLTGLALVNSAPLVVIAVTASLAAGAITLTRPTQGALFPLLSRTPEELTAANVTAGWIEGLGLFAGPLATAILLSVASPAAVFLVMGGVLLGSALLVTTVTAPGRPVVEEGHALYVARDWLEGFETLAREPRPRLIVSLMSAHFVLVGALDVLLVVLAFQILGIGSAGAGFLNAAFGVGGLVGASLALVIMARRRLVAPLLTGIFAWGVGLALLSVVSSTVFAAILVGLAGAGRPLVDVAGRTFLQRVIHDRVLTRVFGVLEGLSMAAQALGMFLVPALFSAVSAKMAFLAVGAFLPAFAAVFWRQLRAIDDATAIPEELLALVRRIPIFAGLSPFVTERMASQMIPFNVDAGTPIIRQGEIGDRFYIIESGQVEVCRDGTLLAIFGQGNFFGEIALLRDIPRTADVIALSDVQLHALERRDFLEAVTGQRQTMEEFESVSQSRLAEQMEKVEDARRAR